LYGWCSLSGECFLVRPLSSDDLSTPPSHLLSLIILYESAIPPLVSHSVSRPLEVYTRRHP
ncbi:hypothetical protein GIB67_037942, partial [Kingdonia uniflora]